MAFKYEKRPSVIRPVNRTARATQSRSVVIPGDRGQAESHADAFVDRAIAHTMGENQSSASLTTPASPTTFVPSIQDARQVEVPISAGHPLPARSRALLESAARPGVSLAAIRVHDEPRAHGLVDGLHARAARLERRPV